MQSIVVPTQARRILFLGGDNVSAQVLNRILQQNSQGGASPIASAKVLRPLVTKEQRNNSHSPHHALDSTCREFNLGSNFVADSKKFKLHDLAITLGMMAASDIPPPIPTTSKNPNPLVGTDQQQLSAAAAPTCPFSVDQVREEFLNQFDATVVASFKHYIPDSLVRAMSPVINMHPSLLPKYRGAAPLFVPVMNGEIEHGASIIRICPKEGMDCGDILKQGRLEIREGEDGRTLYPRVLDLGSNLVRDVLEDFRTHWDNASIQDRKDVKFADDEFKAAKIVKDQSRIDLETWSGDDVCNVWRAFVGSNFAVPFCDIDKTCTPIRAQLKRDDSKKPCRISFTEIVPSCNVREDAKKEVEGVFGGRNKLVKTGSVYSPGCCPSLAAIKCKKGHFWAKRVTMFNAKPQEWALTATSMMMKPGIVYEEVFRTCPKIEDINGANNNNKNNKK